MGSYYGLVVLVVFVLIPARCGESCGGRDGRAGEAGAPGRDGYQGAKGEKGEAAVKFQGPVDEAALRRLKGEAGRRGEQGTMGPKGYRGHLGAPGLPGEPGRPGPEGKGIGHGGQGAPMARSAFSAIRTINTYPAVGRVITYQNTVVNTPEGDNKDFNAATGQFTCRVPGVYYFTFNSVAKVSMCVDIASEALVNKLGFCDYNKNTEQVLSGGVVLQLTAGQKVWLESFRDQQKDNERRDNQEKQTIFSGFLLFASPE
ncbi:complement C1q subcomponent subunit A-like [Eleginops maclovinus]